MPEDTSLPWWLGGEDSPPSEPIREAPYPQGGERVPPPPPPPHQGDSAWLRDSADPFAPPLRPSHEPPTVTPHASHLDAFVDASTPERLSGWSEPHAPADNDWDAPPRRRPRPVSPVAPPPSGRRPATPAGNSKGGGGGIVRVITAIFLVLLLVTGGVAIVRATTGGGGLQLRGLGNIIPPTATPTGFARAAKITFTRTTQTIAAPSSTLIAATDGSGQVKATVQTASVTGATSNALNATFQSANSVVFNLTVTNNTNNATNSVIGLTITSTDGKVTCTLAGSGNVNVPAHGTSQQPCGEPAQKEPAASWNFTDPGSKLTYTGSSPAGGNTAYYFVPTNCGDPSPAVTAAQTAMQSQLGVPAGSVVMYGPKYGTDPASLSCTPAGGTQQPNSFTFTQKINGTGSQTVFAVSDVQQYQAAQIKTKIPTSYALVSSQVCTDGPKIGNDATANRATITCPATASVGWDWTPATLTQLAGGLTGASVDTAKLQLNGTQGVVAGSVDIALTDGSEMPQDASTITFVVTP